MPYDTCMALHLSSTDKEWLHNVFGTCNVVKSTWSREMPLGTQFWSCFISLRINIDRFGAELAPAALKAMLLSSKNFPMILTRLREMRRSDGG